MQKSNQSLGRLVKVTWNVQEDVPTVSVGYETVKLRPCKDGEYILSALVIYESRWERGDGATGDGRTDEPVRERQGWRSLAQVDGLQVAGAGLSSRAITIDGRPCGEHTPADYTARPRTLKYILYIIYVYIHTYMHVEMFIDPMAIDVVAAAASCILPIPGKIISVSAF